MKNALRAFYLAAVFTIAFLAHQMIDRLKAARTDQDARLKWAEHATAPQLAAGYPGDRRTQ